jgi:hypothetical protein
VSGCAAYPAKRTLSSASCCCYGRLLTCLFTGRPRPSPLQRRAGPGRKCC